MPVVNLEAIGRQAGDEQSAAAGDAGGFVERGVPTAALFAFANLHRGHPLTHGAIPLSPGLAFYVMADLGGVVPVVDVGAVPAVLRQVASEHVNAADQARLGTVPAEILPAQQSL